MMKKESLMATKKTTAEAAEAEKMALEPEQTEGLNDSAPQEAEQPGSKNEAPPALESLSVLAERHRVPAWQQAALCRFMDWTDDRLVSDAAYRAALENLKHRRIGGGRR